MSGAIVGEAIERSITEKFPLMGLSLVGLPLMSTIRSEWSIK